MRLICNNGLGYPRLWVAGGSWAREIEGGTTRQVWVEVGTQVEVIGSMRDLHLVRYAGGGPMFWISDDRLVDFNPLND